MASDKRKVIASVSFTVRDSVKKGELRDYIKTLLLSSSVSGIRVNFDSWGGETIIQKTPAKRKKTVLQAGKAKGKGKGKGAGKGVGKGAKKPVKTKTVARRAKPMTNGSIELHTEL